MAETRARDTAEAVATLATKADITTESVTDYTVSASVVTFNLANGNVGFLSASAASNYTLNVTNPVTTDGRSTTVTLFALQGATGYIPNAVQVSGSAQTVRWAGGTAPTPTSSNGKIDVFSFSLIRRSSAWTVLGTSLLNF
jgi:hypothetical protein